MSVSEHEILIASEAEMSVEDILKAIKSMESADVFKIEKACIAELEKRSKSGKGAKPVSEKKRAAPQLNKPKAWVAYTLNYATAYGWEEFVHSENDKKSGTIEETVIPAGVKNEDDEFVISGSITDKSPKGKKLILKYAMTLSKLWWSPKAKSGTHQEIYEAFEAQYVPPVESETASEAGSEESKTTVVRKTAAEREAEKAAKDAAKEAEKEAKKDAKEREKEAKAAAKEAQKEALALLKDAIKSKDKDQLDAAVAAAEEAGVKDDNASLTKAKEMKAALEAVPKSSPAAVKIVKTAVPKPAAAAAPVAPKPAPAVEKASPKPAAAAVKAAPKPKKEEEKWVAPPDDGTVLPWTFKGKKYFRNAQDAVWEADEKGEIGSWAGLYEPATNQIDDTVEEPQFDEE